MKIAFTAQNNNPESILDPRFGRADWLLIHNDCTNTWECINNISGRDASHGAGIQTAQKVVDGKVEAVVTGSIGPKASTSLQAAKIRIFHGAKGTAIEALHDFKAGRLKEACSTDATGGV